MQNYNNINKQKLIDAIFSSNGKINNKNIDISDKNGISKLISSLPESDRKKLMAALSNEEKTKEILSTPAAQKILNSLMNGGKK
ncbi:MAG: hypothetical protein MJ091_01280 [Clostridia bacterium]|nr:hypothetical protein [Clostridia bacterium]